MDDLTSKYFDLLSKWNRKIRLVSEVRDLDEFKQRHVRDALELLPFLSDADTMIDMGTGAGLPGILVKIAKPSIEVTLLDSTRKKIGFCQEAIRALGLVGIRAVCGRAEDEGVRGQLGQFDAVVSRATWKLAEYIDISISYMNCRPGSRVFALKGARWADELAEAQNILKKHRLELDQAHEYTLSDSTPRSILSFKKS